MSRGMQVVVTAIIFTALAGVFILLRCVSRFCITKSPGTEDWLIILALLCSIATTVDYDLRKDDQANVVTTADLCRTT